MIQDPRDYRRVCDTDEDLERTSQFGQISTSIWKTRLSRLAQRIAGLCSAGVRSSAGIGFVRAPPRPRRAGMIRAR